MNIFLKYYLFSKQKQEKAKVDLDLGAVLDDQSRPMSSFKLQPKNFEFTSRLRLPFLIERGLTLLSGEYPKFCDKRKNKKKTQKVFVFKNVPDKIAQLVAEKLGQNLTIERS